MQDKIELEMMQPKSDELHDLSSSSFRFLFVLAAAIALLMLAGVL
jgi:hypothetical protein